MQFYLTTAIDYVNSRPHLGTAYEKITADVVARYKRLCGIETHFVMGNDEHSQNVYKRALERGPAGIDAHAKRLTHLLGQFVGVIGQVFQRGFDRDQAQAPGELCKLCELLSDRVVATGGCLARCAGAAETHAEGFDPLAQFVDQLGADRGEHRLTAVRRGNGCVVRAGAAGSGRIRR